MQQILKAHNDRMTDRYKKDHNRIRFLNCTPEIVSNFGGAVFLDQNILMKQKKKEAVDTRLKYKISFYDDFIIIYYSLL